MGSSHNEAARIKPCDISQISKDLFTSMLGMEINPATNNQDIDWNQPVMASIKINGDWDAEFRVIASDELACKIAQVMFGMDRDEKISQDEVFDAMGEVVNVVGGNAKGIIDSECQLSLPCVGLFDQSQIPNSLSLVFDCNGHPFEVQMFDCNS